MLKIRISCKNDEMDLVQDAVDCLSDKFSISSISKFYPNYNDYRGCSKYGRVYINCQPLDDDVIESVFNDSEV